MNLTMKIAAGLLGLAALSGCGGGGDSDDGVADFSVDDPAATI